MKDKNTLSKNSTNENSTAQKNMHIERKDKKLGAFHERKISSPTKPQTISQIPSLTNIPSQVNLSN